MIKFSFLDMICSRSDISSLTSVAKSSECLFWGGTLGHGWVTVVSGWGCISLLISSFSDSVCTFIAYVLFSRSFFVALSFNMDSTQTMRFVICFIYYAQWSFISLFVCIAFIVFVLHLLQNQLTLIVFSPTPMLCQNFTPAISAFNNNLNCRQHISQTCRWCFYHIHNLRMLRYVLSGTFIQATSIFTFTTHSCKTAQTASVI